MGWWARVLRSRYYIPASLLVSLLLLVGIGVDVLARLGAWPPAAFRPHPSVLITGPGAGASPSATAPAATLDAYVLGAVRSPGAYTLPADARIRDLVAVAGGFLSTADPTRVNLAGALTSGEGVYVPRVGETIPAEIGGRLDLNAASVDDLRNALGISLTIARKIVAYRDAHGPFTAVSQLLLVPVSRTTYDRIKDLVTI